MTAHRRCATVLRHLARYNTTASAMTTPPTKLLCIFDMQPEQVLENMVEVAWLPAAALHGADMRVAKSPEDVTAHLSSQAWSPEVIFSFAETGWAYESMAAHKERLLAGGLRWVNSLCVELSNWVRR
jgi:hypothetical protein